MDPVLRQFRRKLVRTFLKVVAGLVVCSALVLGGYLYGYIPAKKNAADLRQRTIVKNTASDREIVSQVATLMELPKEENPTVIDITNSDELKKQEFFRSAKDGDKVLIYKNAKRAILYRPTSKKIVDIAPINLPPRRSSSEGQASVPSEGSVAGVSIEPTQTPFPTPSFSPSEAVFPTDTLTPIPTQ